MLEALVLLFQLCNQVPCTVNVTKYATILTVCDPNAGGNNAWMYNKMYLSTDEKTVLIVKLNKSICKAI